MFVFLIRRSVQSIIVVIVMAVLVFLGVFVIGDPVMVLIDPRADQIEIARATSALGLDKPMWEQFGLFLSNALAGDLGRSFVTSESALGMILERMPATIELALCAMVIALVLGVPLGMLAGLFPETRKAKLVMAGSICCFSLPSFWVGLMLIMFFAVHLGWLPSNGRGETVDVLGVPFSFLTVDGLQHLALPALNLALFKLAMVIRLIRAGTREVLYQDYIKFARAKGLSTTRLIMVHVLKNILIPLVTVLGLEFGGVIALAVVTETIFSWPGMGKLIIDSIYTLDRPVIVAYLMLTVLMFIVINLTVDLLYTLLDPRVKLAGYAR